MSKIIIFDSSGRVYRHGELPYRTRWWRQRLYPGMYGPGMYGDVLQMNDLRGQGEHNQPERVSVVWRDVYGPGNDIISPYEVRVITKYPDFIPWHSSKYTAETTTYYLDVLWDRQPTAGHWETLTDRLEHPDDRTSFHHVNRTSWRGWGPAPGLTIQAWVSK